VAAGNSGGATTSLGTLATNDMNYDLGDTFMKQLGSPKKLQKSSEKQEWSCSFVDREQV